jgi:cell wall assembly regulator SMI1
MNAYQELIDELLTLIPVYSDILNSGASPAAVVRFKTVIRTDVPNDFLSFYRTVDGCKPDETADIQGMVFHSLKEITESKKLFDKLLAEKQKAGDYFCWHADWLPFADDGSYDTLAIDLSGKATGMKGCVLVRSKDAVEDDQLRLVAPDFGTFIRGWLDRARQQRVYRSDAATTDPENRAAGYDDDTYEDFRSVTLIKD